MYTYNSATGEATRNSDGKVVMPCQSVDDPDFQDYKSWVEAGNNLTIVDNQPKTFVPVTAVQIRLALNQLGLRSELEAALAANKDHQDIFEYSVLIHRDNKFVAQFAQAINKTDAEIDALFELAASIEV